MLIDFETRSVCDLRRAGAYRYAEDPSTRVLMLGWGKDGDAQVWLPGEEFPPEVREHAHRAARGEAVFHAHNAVFERLIWNGPLRRLVPDLPTLPPEAFDCTMARAAAAGWPLNLDLLGRVMGLEQQKDRAGAIALRAVSDGAKRYTAEQFDRSVEYCAQDVRTEAAALARLRPLSRDERQVWLLDQRINDRGVRLDVRSIHRIREVLAEARKRDTARLRTLTGGAVPEVSKLVQMRAWINERLGASGLPVPFMPDMRAETVERFLQYDHLPDEVRQVLQIRADAGGAAVKKLDAMLDCVGADGRARGLLQYHAANTGRWGGRLIQPQNFPRPGEGYKFVKDRVVALFYEQDAETIDAWYPGGVYAAASDALRPLILADEGRILRRADLSAIEARLVLWLAGHDDAMDIFRSGRCIYCEQASATYGRPIVRVPGQPDPPERQNGKVIVLGCFGADTLVLTDYGPRRIVDVTRDMQVWDGTEWVTHGGVIAQGEKETLRWAGVDATPNHRVLARGQWYRWDEVARGGSIQSLALETGLESWLSLVSSGASAAGSREYGFSVLAGGQNTPSPRATSDTAGQRDALPVPPRPRVHTASGGSVTRTSCLRTSPGSDCLTASPASSNGATILDASATDIMEAGAFQFGPLGGPTAASSWRICSRCRAGMNPGSNSIGSITTVGMNPATFASFHGPSTSRTGAPFGRYPNGSPNLNEKSPLLSKRMPTYDIALAGPKARFTILTDEGPLVVHNCGYQMGPARYIEHAATYGLHITPEQAQRDVYSYRERWWRVPEMWRAFERCAWRAFLDGGVHEYRGVQFAMHDGALCVRLHSGRVLRWQGVHTDQTEDDERPGLYAYRVAQGRWERVSLYGGIITERVTQATARDVMVHGLRLAEAEGLPVVLTVHDEAVTEPLTDGPGLDVLVRCLSTTPRFLPGLPLAADGTEGPRYGK
jgi:DNA polymerase